MPDTRPLLDVVRSSAEHVARHDLARWRSIFADDYVIEDPVGSRPVRGEQIVAFWNTFIAPNDVHFLVHHEWVDGFHVVRDVTIETTLATGIVVRTPAHLRYECVEQGGELRVARMAAHWEPAPVFAQLVRPRLPHVRSMLTMNARMVRHLGVGGTGAFVGAVRSAGGRGKQAVLAHLDGSVRDVHKVIAADDVVTLSGTVDGQPAAVVATLDRRTRAVRDSRIYTDIVG